MSEIKTDKHFKGKIIHEDPSTMVTTPKFVPVGDKVLIRSDPVQEKTPGGLYKPETGFAELVWGEVVSVSEGFHSQDGNWIKLQFKPGDRVCYQSGQAVDLEFLPDHALISQATIVLKEKVKMEYPVHPAIKTEKNEPETKD